MVERRADLAEFLRCLKHAFAAADEGGAASQEFTHNLFSALKTSAPAGNTEAAQLPVCQYLPSAISVAMETKPEVAKLAAAFAKIAPKLEWKVRASGGPNASVNWPGGHANAVIVGKGGLEERADVAIGASLLAPHVRYPDHTHPPEELYMIMAPGRFQHGQDDWTEPQAGNTFHNPPGIKHAMASGDKPLLAIWTMLIA